MPTRRRNPHPQTETPAFKRWFGKSVVVDENGAPLVVYHGTQSSFEAFGIDLALFGGVGRKMSPTWFTANPEHAAYFARESGRGGSIMPAYLSIQRPLVVKDVPALGWRDEDKDKVLKRAKRGGYDGVIFPAMQDLNAGVGDTYVVFEPTQIKSATGNAGTFDPKDPSILRNPRVRRRKNSSDDDDADFASYNDLGEDDLVQDDFDADYWNNELQRLCERLDYSLMQSGEDIGRRLDRYGGRGYHDTSPERAALIKREGLGNHPGLTYHGGGGIEGHESPFWMCAWAHPDVAARLLKRGRENGWRDWVEHEVADALSKHLAQRYPNLKAVWFYETKAGGGISKYAGARCSFDLRKVVEWLSANAEDGPYLYNGQDTGWCLSWDGPRIPPKFLRWTRQNPR